ncbi:uncharacterized protein LOC118202039 [Stegodyphus dumicola]|uniref:uncharacterized protein LOC118202039 n=1 Tax=Stegodyphus dumicola TaxID=202533 RepID=UPI0015B23CD0|nr:uncharacterized protein LOC118202039 [Stegodyphus dumicola]
MLNEVLSEIKHASSNEDEVIRLKLLAALNTLSDINCIDNEKENVIKFIIEQISILLQTSKRYNPDILIFASICFYISPQLYKFLRQSRYILLPHPNTIRNINLKHNVDPKQEQMDCNFLLYTKQKFRFLNESDKKVVLLIDEIHVKSYFDYKGGNLTGMAYNNSGADSSVHAFMISSILSSYKDIVHMLPVHTLTASALHSFIEQVIIGLERIGFFVIGIITDNNAINSKAVSLFSSSKKIQIVYPHPVDKKRPLFFLIDSVHIIKCV